MRGTSIFDSKFWVIIVFQCRMNNCIKCSSLAGDSENRKDCIWLYGKCWKCRQLKTMLKIKSSMIIPGMDLPGGSEETKKRNPQTYTQTESWGCVLWLSTGETMLPQ